MWGVYKQEPILPRYTPMSEQNTSLSDHSELSRKLVQVIEQFIDEVGQRNCTSHLDAVLDDGHFFKGRNLGQKPERFTEDHLIFPVLQALGHQLRPRPVQYAPRWSHGRGIPDFALTYIPVSKAEQNDIRLFGEAKPPNKLNYARDDMEQYLKKDLDFHAIAILTDGVDWELWIRPRNEELSQKFTPYAVANIRDALETVERRNIDEEDYHKHHARNKINTDEFLDFTPNGLNATIHDTLEIDPIK